MRQIRLNGGGVVLATALLIAALFAIFGARGSANAQEPPGIPVWLYFVAESGDTCWNLAKEYRDEGRFCDEMLLVNQHIKFANDGEPIIVVGQVYWLHPRWTQSQGEHVLYESNEHMIVPQPKQPPAIELIEPVVQEQGGGDGATVAQITFGIIAGFTTAVLMAVVGYMSRKKIVMPTFLRTFLSRLQLRFHRTSET